MFAAPLAGGLALALALSACGGGGGREGTSSPRTTTEPARPPRATIAAFHGSVRLAVAAHSGRMELSELRLAGRCESGAEVELRVGYPPPHTRFVESIPGVRPAPRTLHGRVPCTAGHFRFRRTHTAVMQPRGPFASSTRLTATARQQFTAVARIKVRPATFGIE